MRFVTTCLVTAGKSNTIGFPVLTKQSYVPNKIIVTEIGSDGEERAVNGILCRVHAGGAEIGNFGEPTFKLTNELNLSSYKGVVDRSGKVSISITNRSSEPKRLKLYTDYTRSHGSVILEEKIDHFENLLNDVHSKGFCTRLVISFNKQVESLEFANVAELEGDGEGNWIEPFNVPIDKELDVDDQVYTIDFTEKDLGPIYSENLNFLQVNATAKKVENDRETFYMFVTAYGFPHQH